MCHIRTTVSYRSAESAASKCTVLCDPTRIMEKACLHVMPTQLIKETIFGLLDP